MKTLAVARSALLAFSWFGLQPAVAADPVVVTSFMVGAPDSLTVGDRFQIVVTLDTAEGTKVTLAPGALPDNLTLVLAPKVEQEPAGSGRQTVTVTMTVAPFATGDLTLPPLKLRYRDKSGATGEVQTPAARISVQSVLPAGGPLTPRDLKPQAEVGTPPAPAYVLIALAATALGLVVVLALIAVRSRYRSRPAPVLAEPAPVALSPEDSARVALDGVAGLPERREYDVYYATIAGTIRGYLTDRFGFPAFALTTAELQDQMVRRGIDRWQARLVGGLLEQCDSVVYAQYHPALDRADADLTAAYEIVEMARPESLEETPV